MDRLQSMRVFAELAELSSVSGAARALALAKAQAEVTVEQPA